MEILICFLSLIMPFMVIYAYRLGLSDKAKIKNDIPVVATNFLEKEEKEQAQDEVMLTLKNIDDYNGM